MPPSRPLETGLSIATAATAEPQALRQASLAHWTVGWHIAEPTGAKPLDDAPLPLFPHSLANKDRPMTTGRSFPPEFLWGTSSAAFQVEGAAAQDGRADSIWDVFARTAGAIADGTDATKACDHYNRVAEDVALMAALGVGAYRFSTAWPRIVPEPTGRPNARALDHYDQVVDRCLAAGVEPWVCLYHWDLPQWAEDEGGWPARTVVGRFADYAEAVASRLADRVCHWVPVNEPGNFLWGGYATGKAAPGRQDSDDTIRGFHHVTYATAEATRAIRAVRADARIGNAMSLSPVKPASADPADVGAAERLRALWNRAIPMAAMTGRYPAIVAQTLDDATGGAASRDPIGAAWDFIGINYYRGRVASFAPHMPLSADWAPYPPGTKLSSQGKAIDPDGLREMLLWLKEAFPGTDLFITENGTSAIEQTGGDGQIVDTDRIAYLRDYLAAAADAVAAGVPLKGHFLWSLLDNFEWEHGLTQRYGIVSVDYDTLARTPKASFDWYRRVIETGMLG